MEEMASALDAVLDWQTLEFSEQMKGMMRHRDHHVEIERADQVEGIDHLPFADQELALIAQAPFRKPGGV
jgi:hypothetical protein